MFSLKVQWEGDVHLDFEGYDGTDRFDANAMSGVAYCPDAYCNLTSLSLLS